MSNNKFVGVAYWSVDTQITDWLARAVDVLKPVQDAGLAVLSYDCLPACNQLTVAFGDERYQMPVVGGKGRGVVRASETAAVYVVCLVALRKALGDISVVTDAQADVATLPRQSDPLYAGSWQRVLPVAQELGLATGAAFMARHSEVLHNMF